MISLFKNLFTPPPPSQDELDEAELDAILGPDTSVESNEDAGWRIRAEIGEHIGYIFDGTLAPSPTEIPLTMHATFLMLESLLESANLTGDDAELVRLGVIADGMQRCCAVTAELGDKGVLLTQSTPEAAKLGRACTIGRFLEEPCGNAIARIEQMDAAQRRKNLGLVAVVCTDDE